MIIKNNDPFTQPSFSLKNRLVRSVWNLVQSTLFRFSPRTFHGWRSFLLRLFGAKLGVHVHIYSNAKIWAPWNLITGDFVGVADGVTIYNIAPVTIGSHCVVSQGAYLCTGSHDIDSNNFQLVASPIRLGDYSWVCAQAFIGPGVQITEGCVIGARAVVVKSVNEPWTVWAGNPATYKRHREKAILEK